MNVIIISHTYIIKTNRKKWLTLARLYPEINLKVIFPQKWRGTLSSYNDNLDLNENLPNCTFHPLKVFFGDNEVKYFYKPNDLIKIFKSFKPALVHVEQGDNSLSYLESIILSKLFNKKARFCFFTWVNWHHNFSLKYKIFWKLIEKINLKSSSGAFVGNVGAKQILESKKFKSQMCVLPQLGVDTNQFFPNESQPKDKIIGFAGRLVPEKGILTLVNAFSRIADSAPEWKLFILGNGPYEEHLKDYVRIKSLVNKVIFHPSVPHEEIANKIQKFSIFVLPSFDTDEWKEQFGHVIIEAMACGVPVIGSDAGEIPNVIEDAGLIFNQKKSLDLARCMKLLIEDSSKRDYYGKAGLNKVKEKYSNEVIAAKTYSFWQKLLN